MPVVARHSLLGRPHSVRDNRDDMARATREHENVPRAVAIAHAMIVDAENDADRIRESARDQPAEAFPADRGHQWVDRKYSEPAEREIAERRDGGILLPKANLRIDPQRRTAPHDDQ